MIINSASSTTSSSNDLSSKLTNAGHVLPKVEHQDITLTIYTGIRHLEYNVMRNNDSDSDVVVSGCKVVFASTKPGSKH